ncbi:MAG: ABC transporter ATP-binding protein [Candidatus Hydrogenedentes bacterium]|nr:ABC transporter ATP-binding protein [Candidatus Hydrogenedentota bacterium]
MAVQNAIDIRNLEKRFAQFKLGPLDLTVPQGAVYGLIGPNGAGKTTTINLIMGMGEKDAGTIRVFGMDHLGQEVAVKKRVGYVAPDLILTAWKTVRRLIAFVRPFYSDWDDAYCEDLMRRLAIGWSDRIASLSYGNATKLRLILALAHRPDLLLLDEPMAGLDAVSKQEVFQEIFDAVQDENRSVLISSHDLHDLERITDHIGFLNRGRMMLEGPTADIVNRYRLVDSISAETTLGQFAGARIVSRENGRLRILLDISQSPLDTLPGRGIEIVAATPVTLEELFIMLVKEG